MTRDDFLKELRIALQGRIRQGQVNEQLQYYENYIIEESRKGKTEEQVLEELGNPRLIARTIIDAFGDGLSYEERSMGQQMKKERWIQFRLRHGRLLSIILLVLFFICLVKIGILLLPVLAAVILVGGILYLLFRLFFENKK